MASPRKVEKRGKKEESRPERSHRRHCTGLVYLQQVVDCSVDLSGGHVEQSPINTNLRRPNPPLSQALAYLIQTCTYWRIVTVEGALKEDGEWEAVPLLARASDKRECSLQAKGGYGSVMIDNGVLHTQDAATKIIDDRSGRRGLGLLNPNGSFTLPSDIFSQASNQPRRPVAVRVDDRLCCCRSKQPNKQDVTNLSLIAIIVVMQIHVMWPFLSLSSLAGSRTSIVPVRCNSWTISITSWPNLGWN